MTRLERFIDGEWVDLGPLPHHPGYFIKAGERMRTRRFDNQDECCLEFTLPVDSVIRDTAGDAA